METPHNLKIEKVWFDVENIYILTNKGTQKKVIQYDGSTGYGLQLLNNAINSK